MTPPLTPQPDRLLEPTAAAETTSTQLFGVLYITLTGLLDSVVPNSGPWSLLGRSVSYIINLATPHPKPSNASTYNWFLTVKAKVERPEGHRQDLDLKKTDNSPLNNNKYPQN
ncbi:hypothetical protein DSO57_1035096 [Entomophthora muscae]|uniref:Uncharacterized protein n=1 Tax=Entomophthora muscae TaxID=34485 RepID=A0ACC2RQM9_9FUNG|nr:hypothetical protein DSO57_1035096 [Entomophthora muscae]